MKKNQEFGKLRARAEARLRSFPEFGEDPTSEEVKTLLHELQVYQVELEMQNEELRLSQQRLEESRDQYADLFEFAPVGYCILDRSGLVLNSNLTACRLLGIERSRFIGRPFSAFIAGGMSEQGRFRSLLKRVFESNIMQSYELQLIRKDNPSFTAHLDTSVTKNEKLNSPQCRMAITDITSKKETEKLLALTQQQQKEKEQEIIKLRAAELERQNKELKQFTYLASHDLQAPLTTISNYSQLLARKYKGKSDEPARMYIGFISDAVNRMKTQIKDLLDYSLIGQTKERTLIDCNLMIKTIQGNLSFNISKSKATFEIGTLPQIQGYKTELYLLFQNVISNALKFQKKDVNPHIKIAAQKESGSWRFMVQDNGIGIERQYQERIFVIFQRLHTREEYEGTGIGLAHCQKIVELHGGKIWVESQPDVGSTFYFTILELVWR